MNLLELVEQARLAVDHVIHELGRKTIEKILIRRARTDVNDLALALIRRWRNAGPPRPGWSPSDTFTSSMATVISGPWPISLVETPLPARRQVKVA